MKTNWTLAVPEPCSTSVFAFDWLTQPVATVLAACIAVGAASIAYAGVLKTTSTARRENRRAERVAVLTEGQLAFADMTRVLMQIAQLTDLPKREVFVNFVAEGRMNEINQAASEASVKIAMYGFADVRKATNDILDTSYEMWRKLAGDMAAQFDVSRIVREDKASQAAFRRAFNELDRRRCLLRRRR